MRSFVLFAVLILLPVFTNAQSTEALQSFERAVAESRQSNHSAALDRFEQTIAILERDSASDAFLAKVHYNAGVSLYHLDRTFESAAHLEKALSYARGRHAKAYYLLGLMGLEAKDLDVAERSLRSAAALDSRNGDVWYDLSRVYVAQNEPAKAKRAFDKAVKNGAVTVQADSGRAAVAMLIQYE